jgi:hypothetical protein
VLLLLATSAVPAPIAQALARADVHVQHGEEHNGCQGMNWS